MSKPRGRWKCLWNCVALSRRLGRCSLLAEAIYIRGIAVSDAHGMLRRDDVRAAILPTRKGFGPTAVAAAIDELIALKLLCQQEDGGEPHLHWCFHDDYQQPRQRTGRRGPPLFTFTCPNEKRQIQSTDKSGVVRTTPAKQQTTDNRHRQQTAAAPPTPPAVPPPSDFINAVIAQWPLGGGAFYGRYLRLEEEYGTELMWECWLEALDNGKPAPQANYLEAIARNAVAEGRRPGERREATNNGRDEKPTEIDGRAVVGWVGDKPVYAAPAKAP